MSTSEQSDKNPQACEASGDAGRPGWYRRLVQRAGQKPWMSRLAVLVYMLGVAGAVQTASTPDNSQFWLNVVMYVWVGWPLLGAVVILAATVAILWAITGRLRLACALTPVLWIPVALANAAKLSNLDLPLLPADFALFGDTISVFHREFLAVGGIMKFTIMAIMGTPAILAFPLIPAGRMRPLGRAIVGVLAVTFFASLFTQRMNVFASESEQFPKYNWDVRRTYTENGFIVCMAMHCRYLTVETPPGYSPEAMAEIATSVPAATTQPAIGVRPNVIVILSESFCDPTRFPGVTFDSDPVPTFHQLQRDFGGLDVVSPVFGGLTCNAEFEVLTGLDMAFFPPGTGAYVDYIRRPVPSLASMLRRRGYDTITLHAMGGVHNDAQVQPLLGFEQCIPGSKWANQQYISGWMSDESATLEILRWSEQLCAPYFICVNTIENHTPFNAAKYGDDSSCGIRFAKPLPAETREILTSYAHGLQNADAALKELIDRFRDVKTPTLIVFYGDHLPILGDDMKAYRDTAFAPDCDSTTIPMRRMQAVIWNNYGKRLPATSQPTDVKPVGMNQMLPIILDLLDAPKPPHVRLIEQIGRRWPVIGLGGCLNADGEFVPFEKAKDDPAVNLYRLMQHDILFGDQHMLRIEP